MSSTYDELIASLKNQCRNKRVKYKKIIRTLNRYEYDEIIHMIEIINDDSIGDIIEEISLFETFNSFLFSFIFTIDTVAFSKFLLNLACSLEYVLAILVVSVSFDIKINIL
jgi:hypothetical protein